MQSFCDVAAAAELRSVLTTPSVHEIRETLVQVRPDLSTDSLTFRAAVLLMVGPALGFNVDRLAGRTQCPRAFVAACARRLIDNGVWQADGPVYTWTAPDDPQFWKDVEVAEGKLCRRQDPLGRIEWASAGSWWKAYDFVAEKNTTPEKSAVLSVAYATRREADPWEAADHEPFKTRTVAGAELPITADAPVPIAARATLLERFALPGFLPMIPAGVPAGQPAWQTVESNQAKDLFPGAQWLS